MPIDLQARWQQAPLILLLNRAAGAREGGGLREHLEAALKAAGRVVEVVQLRSGRGMPAALEYTLRRARALDGIPVAVGGDGSISALAGAVLDDGRPIGVIPHGTFNYFARALGIPLDVDGALHGLLDARIASQPVGRVNGRPFLVSAGVGLYPQLLEDREAFLRHAFRNRWLAAACNLWLALREWRQLRLEPHDGDAASRTPTLFVCNNRVQLEDLGFAPLLDALDDACLIGLKLRPVDSRQLLALILRGALGRLGDADRIDRFAFRALRVHPPGRRRLKVALDGEVCRMRAPLLIDLAPQPLRVLVPASA